MFMFHDIVSNLWTSLTQMYAHECNDSRIFELYRDVAQASQATLGLSVADYFGHLQFRWENWLSMSLLVSFRLKQRLLLSAISIAITPTSS